jgi:hypothetical protein
VMIDPRKPSAIRARRSSRRIMRSPGSRSVKTVGPTSHTYDRGARAGPSSIHRSSLGPRVPAACRTGRPVTPVAPTRERRSADRIGSGASAPIHRGRRRRS